MAEHSTTSTTNLMPEAASAHGFFAPAWRFVLIDLWLVWAVLLLGGFLWGSSVADSANRIPAWCRMGSSFALVLAGWAWWLSTRGGRAHRYAFFIAVGMTLGWVGDLFNAHWLTLGLPDPVLGGIISFGLGHIAYITACVVAGRQCQLQSAAARNYSLLAWGLFGLVGWYFVVYQGSKNADLVGPALPYTLLLAGTAGMATALAVQDRRFLLLACGAALFLISDLVLAFRLFYGEFPLGGDAVWLLYGPGQMLIVFALVTARSRIDRLRIAS